MLDVGRFLAQLGRVPVLEDDLAAGLAVFIPVGHPADAAARAGAPDGLEVDLGQGQFVATLGQDVLERRKLVDFELVAGDGEDGRLADVEQRIAHAFQVAEDEKRGQQVAGLEARAQLVADAVELLLVKPVQVQFAAADLERRRHVAFEHGLGRPFEGLFDLREKRLVRVALDALGFVVVAGLAHHVDHMVAHAFEVVADDVERAHPGRFLGGEPLGPEQCGEAAVFDDALEVVDIVVAGLDLGDGPFVVLFDDGHGRLDLPFDFDEQELEVCYDLMHRPHPLAR